MSSSVQVIARPLRHGVVGGAPLDAWLAGGMAVLNVGYAFAWTAEAAYRPAGALALVLAAAGPLALVWRQRVPLAALVGADAALLANAAAGHRIGFLEWPAWIALFTCFAVGGRRLRIAASLGTGLTVAGYLLVDRGDPVGSLPSIVTSFLVATVAGGLSSRRARSAAADARQAAESREAASAAERLLLGERARLARELHDSLGHTVNVMVLQAGVGRRVFTDNPAYARDALSHIESAGRGALDELNRLLRVLQPDGRDSVEEPFAPTVADLEQLADRIRATGRQVSLRTDAADLPASGARAVYRIVQEALTNAVRHGSPGPIRVEVVRSGSQVRLEVVTACDRVADAVPGHGLVNMAERARLEGGELVAGPVDGWFRVRASLPVTAGVGV